MAWLGEELPEDQQDGATPFAPRCVKDVMEEDLFACRRDLLTTLDVVFMVTELSPRWTRRGTKSREIGGAGSHAKTASTYAPPHAAVFFMTFNASQRLAWVHSSGALSFGTYLPRSKKYASGHCNVSVICPRLRLKYAI